MNTELQSAITGIVVLILGEKLKGLVDKKWVATLALVLGLILNTVYAQLTGGTMASALTPGLAGGATAITLHEVLKHLIGGLLKPKP